MKYFRILLIFIISEYITFLKITFLESILYNEYNRKFTFTLQPKWFMKFFYLIKDCYGFLYLNYFFRDFFVGKSILTPLHIKFHVHFKLGFTYENCKTREKLETHQYSMLKTRLWTINLYAINLMLFIK